MEECSRSPEGLDFLTTHLTPEQFRDLVNYHWAVAARDDQLAPVFAKGGGRWHTWLLLGGRGSGKTRAGAEWVRAQVVGEPPLADRRSRRIALVGNTIAQVRSIMIEGVSGLMSASAPTERPKLEVSRNQLVWSNGTMAQLFGADDPDSLRGPQFDAAWCDELAKWRRPDLAWDNLQFALRLGRWPQCVITTTPRPILLLKKILEDAATAVTRSRTADNASFLSPSFLAEMQRRYGDTPIGRQELEGEIVEERMTGLWKRSQIDQARMLARPELVRIVVAVDPPVTSTAGSDSCGIIVAGLGVDKRAYVIADRTVQGRDPTTWARAAVAAYHDHQADAIVVETNQGGDLLVQMFKSIDACVPVKKVEAWAARERAQFALPPSRLALEPGDTVSLAANGRAHLLRITEIGEHGARDIEALSLDPDVYANAPGAARDRGGSVAVIAGQPFVAFLDLPLLRSDTPPAAGYVAVAQSPWPGPIAIYRSPETSGFRLEAIAPAPAVTAVTLDPLPAGPTSRLDGGTSIRVQLDLGTLASVTELALLGGANLAAVRNEDGEWEVLQFLSAVLIAPVTYALSGFLRGQGGTEHAMRGAVAPGARFVLLDAALARIDMTEDEVGLAFHWRCGPASRDLGSPNYVQLTHAFVGEGLKPLAPVHVRGARSAGDLNLTWIRRTRIGGDSWDAVDVPLGEAEERYEIDILAGVTVKRTIVATSPAATYTAAQQTADFGAPQPSISLRIHQMSATRGRGSPGEAVV